MLKHQCVRWLFGRCRHSNIDSTWLDLRAVALKPAHVPIL
ncbi:hypothetical protein FRUB_06638 [Fimbriiglobus ruber]|uniref:Uncharacterized protein n=1 Tax=Fimbriiglobus ruber TaxID=1908690 RepID=A0A225DG79_9BACT|nr:hypothetical protein FRUB_06638 [Fimbriiglobus ruber]